jgi:hypothetical protein
MMRSSPRMSDYLQSGLPAISNRRRSPRKKPGVLAYGSCAR